MFKKLLLISSLFTGLAFSQTGAGSLATGNSQIYHNQQAVTSSATALANQPLKTICVKAMHANATTVYVGNSGLTTANGMELIADQSWCASVDNANRIYIIGTSGANVSWIGTN